MQRYASIRDSGEDVVGDIGDSDWRHPRRSRLGAVPDVLPGAPERPSRKVAVQKLDALILEQRGYVG
jgi:hypothetical protein